jgi:hypothetical protein
MPRVVFNNLSPLQKSQVDGTSRAALIYFRDGLSEEVIRQTLEKLALVIDSQVVVNEYAPEHGSPCFYIP